MYNPALLVKPMFEYIEKLTIASLVMPKGGIRNQVS